MLETAVRELKQEISASDGRNVAGRAFVRRVDDLISVFYDDIGEITTVSTRTLFDLFVIKVLYVERSSTDAAVVDYLGQLLERYLDTRELFPISRGGRLSLYYLSDLLEETQRLSRFQNLFEAYRKYGDNSLFVTGIFPRALRRRRAGRWSRPVAFVDRSYYVSTGKRFYLLAAQHELAELTEQRRLLEKLSAYFEVYVDALNDMSDRYVMGFDLNLIADKMLDNFNRFRRTGEERFLLNARRYAAILKLDPESFPSLMKRGRPKGYVLEPPHGPPPQ
ncbi:MAG: hypothetical protein U1B78_06140 [Dehalococcoidia bacterium]|nr:hypothetical protein [Dehalococcoidia bacterium]